MPGNIRLKAALLLPTVAISTACVASTEHFPGEGARQEGAPSSIADAPTAGHQANETADDSAVFTRMIVVFDGAGTPHVSSGPITRAAQKAEAAERLVAQARPEHVPVSPDAIVEACNSSDYTIIYSGPNFTGNETCFYNSAATPMAVDLVDYRQNISLFSSTWFQCAPGTLEKLGGPCSAGGTSAVRSYISFTNACFSESESSLTSFFFTNVIGESGSVPSNITSDEFLWLASSGASCEFPIIYHPRPL